MSNIPVAVYIITFVVVMAFAVWIGTSHSFSTRAKHRVDTYDDWSSDEYEEQYW